MAAGLFDYTHVPFKGPRSILTEMMANRIDCTIVGIDFIPPYIKAGGT